MSVFMERNVGLFALLTIATAAAFVARRGGQGLQSAATDAARVRRFVAATSRWRTGPHTGWWITWWR